MKKVLISIMGVVLICSAGCLSKPSRVEAPALDPEGHAAKAMTEYDKNGDGKIAGDELDACLGMKSVLADMDTNKDGALDKGEIANRIKSWVDSKVGLTCPSMSFTKGKKALKTGKISLVPEAFLSDVLKQADADIAEGSCSPSSAGNVDNLPGMAYGFYKIQLDGADTGVGVEISDMNPMVRESGGSYNIDLKK